MPFRRILKRARRIRRIRYIGNWCVTRQFVIGRDFSRDASVESACALVWAADTHILFSSAVREAWCPRQTASPGCIVAYLPSTHYVIGYMARVPHILLAFSEGQFVYGT